MQLGDTVQDFKAEAPDGSFQFYDYVQDSWCLSISHPGTFTPKCTTELSDMIKQDEEFKDRGVKVVEITLDTKENTAKWVKDSNVCSNVNPSNTMPLIADKTTDIGVYLGMIRPENKDKPGLKLTGRHPTDSIKVSSFIPPEEAYKIVKSTTVEKLSSGKPYLQFFQLI